MAFSKLFVGLPPAQEKTPSVLERLKPWRSMIAAKKNEGYSLRQIADRLKQPPFSISTSPSTLMVLIGGAAAKRRAKIRKLARLRAANLAKAAAPAQPTAAPTTATVLPVTAAAVRRV